MCRVTIVSTHKIILQGTVSRVSRSFSMRKNRYELYAERHKRGTHGPSLGGHGRHGRWCEVAERVVAQLWCVVIVAVEVVGRWAGGCMLTAVAASTAGVSATFRTVAVLAVVSQLSVQRWQEKKVRPIAGHATHPSSREEPNPCEFAASTTLGRAEPADVGWPTRACGRNRPGTTLMPSSPPGLSCLR